MSPTSAGISVGEWNSPQMVATSISVPRRFPSCLLPVWEALQDQQLGPTQVPFKLVPLCWDLERMFLCMSFKSRISVSYSLPALLNVSSVGSQSQTFGYSTSQFRTPGLVSLMWGSDPSLLGEDLRGWDSLPAYGLPHQEGGSWLDYISTAPTHFMVVPSLYL